MSFQVLQEYYVTVTMKLSPGLAAEEDRDDVRSLYAWSPLLIDSLAVDGAWRIQDRHGSSWWDSLIVSELLSKVGDGGFQAARSISFSPSLNLTPSTISARR